jgi:hypothetical protein
MSSAFAIDRGAPGRLTNATSAERGVAYYLTCLQRYLETGHGAVHGDVDLARVAR